ncbi:TonB-dependent receptor [Olivibacter sp. SDN3]|uniref:SusC/RagA family TonB-linked outer membrane protein n=1 Tax=Olivibacter sp. SDN3 TaxID=2764720 RepID=UPI0016516980|nr:TonB-dependent receptor [Olivibacter sp. SDN3]QNL50841.1 TonB-dependent receptor [Olivibacter sp. SDN3]
MKQKLLSFFLVCTMLLGVVYAQERRISGKVTEENGSGLPGVSVVVTGTTSGTQTDNEGNYSISVPADARTLTFSYIGYRSITEEIGGESTVNVTLSLDASELSEVIVTGYGTQRRQEFTGSASSVRGDVIKSMPIQSFGQGLTGQATGVNVVQPNGLLNNPPVIRVRGLSSLSLSSFPLVVVDGIPITTDNVTQRDGANLNSATNNPLGDINPADIESMDILKDAASAAIYGSRAAAGVLVITTKKGKQGRTNVTYDGWIGNTQAIRLQDVLNAEQYVAHKNTALANALAINPNAVPANQRDEEGRAFFLDYYDDGSLVDTRWYDEVYRSAWQQNHNLTVSGGTEKTKYYFSAGLTDQNGFLKANTFKRKSARMNIDHQATDWLNLMANVNYTNAQNNAPNSGSIDGGAYASSGLGRIAMSQMPNVRPFNSDGSYAMESNAIHRGANLVPAQWSNPYPLIDLDRNSSETSRLLANLGATLKLAEGLNFRTTFSWDLRNIENKRFWNPLQGDGWSSTGQAFNNNIRSENWNWVNTLTYDKTFADVHNLSLLIGSDAQKRRDDAWGANRAQLADPFYDQFQGVFLQNTPGGNFIDEIAYEAYLGSVSYNYDNKYYISANYRRDGNSALSPNNRWGNFGGASVGYTISNEEFFKNSNLANTMSNLRLKASWGRVGNGNLNNFYGAYNLYQSGIYGGVSRNYYIQAGNEDLKWETSTQMNIGLDVGFFNNRLNLEANWYNKDIDNMILGVPQSPSKGIPNPVTENENTILMNVGSMYNRGFEFNINATPIDRGDFTWTTSLNFSTLKNEVTSLVDESTPLLAYTSGLELTSITSVGYSAASIFGVKTVGVNPENGRRIFETVDGRQVQYLHGGEEFVDANGNTFRASYTNLDGTPASGVNIATEQQILGNTIPTWFGGFNNNFRYKAFDLGLIFTFSGGNYIYNGTRAGLLDQRVWNNSTEVLNAWTPENTGSSIPRAVYGDNVSNGSSFLISEHVEKGDFLRLQNISLGYTLPTRLFGNSGIQSVRVYGSAQNLFLITGYSGVDPEISSNGNQNLSSGIERNSVPQARTFTMGLTVGF